MSTKDLINKSAVNNKRKAERDAADLKDDFDRIKTIRIIPDRSIIDHPMSNELSNKEFIDEALKTLEDLRRDLNTDRNGLESPETSDCEYDSDNNGCDQESVENAHFLGYTACIQETFRFLDKCGIPKSDPIYEQLKKHFIESSDRTVSENLK
jgi:hypothetical protein